MTESDNINANVNAASNEYDASKIKVLEGLEPVRQRPWMYIGSTDVRWLHHLVYEIVDNAVDESMAGFCKNITVILHNDWYVTVFDDWRWIPVDKHPKTWKSALETAFTILHAWWKFEKWVYKVSWWLHWVWASVVNALSEHLIAMVYKNWKIYKQEYKIWVPVTELEIIWDTEFSWTLVKFKPDADIFETTKFSYWVLAWRLKNAAYLTPWVIFTILDEETNQRERFYFEWWIKTWLKNLIWNEESLSPTIYINKEWNDILVEACLEFVNNVNYTSLSFVNNISTIDWWTHVLGFKSALLKVVNEIAESKWEIDKKVWEFQISDITDWIYSIISVKIPEPQFEWQTKWKLWNSYVRGEVETIVYDYLKQYFTENEEVFKTVIDKIKLSAKARMAAKLAKETVLRKNAMFGWVLPWKLSDCSIKAKEWTELFIVEGNSAWGSAKQWRDSKFQAILPLRGKILNTEQATLQRIMLNNEVKSLVTAIWAWIKESYDWEKLRYNKIIIMTDADVDGAHIRTLLLTFFFRYMRNLIEWGNLFIAVPPLYKIKQWSKEVYLYPPEDDISIAIKNHNFKPDQKYDIQRYKGLWEMNPQQLWDTTMNPETRKLLQVSVEDAENANTLFRILMWEDVASRKHFILTHAKTVRDLDI